MSEDRKRRIAVLQHARCQRRAAHLLMEGKPDRRVISVRPIDAADSLELEGRLRGQLESLRRMGRMRVERYEHEGPAIHRAMELASSFGKDKLWVVSGSSGESGFFRTSVSADTWYAALQAGFETIYVLEPDLKLGVGLDEVEDDPKHGDFFEIEWWGPGGSRRPG